MSGATTRTRTPDRLLTRQMLYQLSYGGLRWLREPDSNRRPIGYEPIELPLLHRAKLVSVEGFEPTTPRVQGEYSNLTELHTDTSPLGDCRSCSASRS